MTKKEICDLLYAIALLSEIKGTEQFKQRVNVYSEFLIEEIESEWHKENVDDLLPTYEEGKEE